MSIKKEALDRVNTLTINDDGEVESVTLMHVPTKINTERDWDCFDIEVESSGNVKEGVSEKLIEFVNKHMKAAAHKGYDLGIQHARQGERSKLIKFITWVRNHYAVNAVIDNKGMVDFYLEQEGK